MTSISKGKKSGKLKDLVIDRDAFFNRVTKTLYYSKLPSSECLGLPVTELAAELFTEVKSGRTLERLDVEEAGRISREAYASPCSLVLALLYLERLKDCNPEYLQRTGSSELFLVSMMVASKFLHDFAIYNDEWTEPGNVTISKINRLEVDFLMALDWSIFVNDEEFWARLHKLERDIAYKESRKRGWLSYTELCCLMDIMQLSAAMQTVVAVSSICLATYAVGVVTLLGSALVASQLPGGLLSPRQANANTASNVSLDPIISNDSVATTPYDVNFDFVCSSTTLNQSDCQEIGNNTDDYKWQWWLSSVMIWLPEYSTLNSEKSLDDVSNLDDGTFVKAVSYVRTAEAQSLLGNWKDILNLNDWRYYADYIRVSLT